MVAKIMTVLRVHSENRDSPTENATSQKARTFEAIVEHHAWHIAAMPVGRGGMRVARRAERAGTR